MRLLLILTLIHVISAQRMIFVTPADWVSVLQGASTTWGALQPGDTIQFNGTAANPIAYLTNTAVSFSIPGTAVQPILITGEENGGVNVGSSLGTGGVLEIFSGQFFTIRFLNLIGGASGIRIATSSVLTDTVTDATFDHLSIFNFVSVGIDAAIPPGTAGTRTLTRLTFSNVEVRNPTMTGTINGGFVFGRVSGTRITTVTATTINNCFIHDLWQAASQAVAIRVRRQCNSITISNNVINNVGIGVLLEDTFGATSNTAVGNVVWNARTTCMQGCAFSNWYSNICFDSGVGFDLSQSGLQSATVPRSINFVYNTLLRGTGPLFQSISTFVPANTVVVGNNILFNDNGNATSVTTANNAAITFGLNVLLGGEAQAIITNGVTLGGTTSTYLQNTGAVGDTSSAWPRIGPVGVLGASSPLAQFQAVPNKDFNCVTRSTNADIGAYDTQGQATNPGWPISGTFRNPALCPPPPPTTTTTTTATPTTNATANVTTTTATTTATTSSTTTPVGGLVPTVPCNLQQAQAGFIPFQVVLSTPYNLFDCSTFLTELASEMGISTNEIGIQSTASGSTFVNGDAISVAAVNQFLDTVAAGNSKLPVTSASGNGRVVQPPTNTPSGFPYWIIIVAAVGGCLVIVAIIVVIVLATKKHKKDKERSQYVQTGFSDTEYVDAHAVNTTRTSGRVIPVPAPRTSENVSYRPPVGINAGPMQSTLVQVVVRYAVVDKGQGILAARAGDVAFAEQKDWVTPGPWLWVRIGSEEGWVPRDYCVEKK